MNEFYNKIVPLALKKIMKAHDPAYPEPQFVDKLETPTRGAVNRGKLDVEGPHKFGFTTFPITDAVKESVKGGQPLFALGGSIRKYTDPKLVRSATLRKIFDGVPSARAAMAKKH